MSAQSQRVNVSMVSLKWGDVLSMLLPGAVALYAIAPYFPLLQQRINEIFEHTGASAPGTAFTLTLLIAAALIGGILEANHPDYLGTFLAHAALQAKGCTSAP